MSEYTYTGADFERAHFAIDPSVSGFGQNWVRWGEDNLPWRNGRGEWASDDGMAEARCIPVYAEPYSPEALQRAWEHGEQHEPGEQTTEGMVTLLRSMDGERYTAYTNVEGSYLLSRERIIYRPTAPERDPVADLTQALEDVLPEEAGSPVALRRYAEALAEYGVKVVTDDEC